MDGKWFLLAGLCAVLFQLAGFFSPGWLRLETIEINFNIGLWFICLADVCVSHYNEFDEGWNKNACKWII